MGMIESLEPRQLMAAQPAEPMIYVFDQVLHLEGTKHADHFTVAMNGATGRIDLTYNGVTTSFEPTDLKGMVLDGKGGKDIIEIMSCTVPVTLIGGAGKDTLIGTDSDLLIQGKLPAGVV
jgi:hypothetical protein